MKKFRRGAVASATAVALALAGTGVASAQTLPNVPNSSVPEFQAPQLPPAPQLPAWDPISPLNGDLVPINVPVPEGPIKDLVDSGYADEVAGAAGTTGVVLAAGAVALALAAGLIAIPVALLPIGL